MRTGWIVTSAVNTKFGIFSAADRLQQTVDTITGITDRCPDAYIVLVEMAGEKVQPDQKAQLSEITDAIIDYSATSDVAAIYQNPNWDIVKNATEIMCFQRSLGIIKSLKSAAGIDRWFKISGRYLLNDNFSLGKYERELKDCIVFARHWDSQFTPTTTGGVTKQLMSRLWSFPGSKFDYVESMFMAMSRCFTDIAQKGGYIDIEHLLYLYVDPKFLIEVDGIGVQGILGPNGLAVRD